MDSFDTAFFVIILCLSFEFRQALRCHFDIAETIVAGFAFYCQRSFKPDFLQCFQEGHLADLSCTPWNFRAPCAWHFGAGCVFDVNMLYPWREHTDRFDGIAFVVEDHVGRVEVDRQSRVVHFFKEVLEVRCRFLTGLQEHRNVFFGTRCGLVLRTD